jgi:acetyl-CoA acetyltransferase
VSTASIVGLGQTEFSKDAGRSETRLAAEAILAALADAGLTVADVDGLVSYTIDPVEETELVRTLGIPAVTWSSRVPYGGGGSQGVVQHAAAAVAYGAARTVVAYRACKTRSSTRYGSADVRPSSGGHGGTTAMQWCLPYGVLTPASWMSLNSTRYMHDYGATSADFGRAVVQLRAYAATNPNAHFHGRPITLDDHQASRWIAEPAIRLFDCCQETDGAVALIITGPDRAADTPRPVDIVAAVSATPFEEEVATNHYTPDLAVMGSTKIVGERLFEGTGTARAELDVAMIYDAFTPMLFMQLEALGLCGIGEAKDYVADGRLGPSGLPTNTNGGLIGEGYIHGLNLTGEAVRQLRGDSVNQVPDARTAVVSAGRTGLLLRR